VVPAISTVAAVLSVPLLRILDRVLEFRLFNYTSDGARALASIISAAVLSFIVFFFSVLLLTVQIASSTLSPRIISRPFRSRSLKLSLGLFVFTLIYSMAVVAKGTERNMGQLVIAMVVILIITSICVFLYVVEHVSKQLRPVTVMGDVALEGLQVIRAVYPKMLEQHGEPEKTCAEVHLGAPSQAIRYTGDPGVVLALDIEGLVALAIDSACMIEVVPQVGDPVAGEDLVLRLYGGGANISPKKLLEHIAVDRERTLEQDPAFAFRIIVDIAAKALSPAINDPTTAVIALDQIHSLLREVGLRRLDTGLVRDPAGQLRLIYHTPDWEDFVRLAATEIRQFGRTSIQVVRRMRAMLENLIPSLPPHRSAALRRELDLLDSTADQAFAIPEDRKRAALPDFQGLGGCRRAV
jgi:uncharacterized membrane protein